jgi:cupin 2 domain-containing protein
MSGPLSLNPGFWFNSVKHDVSNLFSDLPTDYSNEIVNTLLHTPNCKIERILSKGHQSPKDFWYDQKEDEWVLLMQGEAIIQFADFSSLHLKTGDFHLIQAHRKHRVEWTSTEPVCIWLAIFLVDTSHA